MILLRNILEFKIWEMLLYGAGSVIGIVFLLDYFYSFFVSVSEIPSILFVSNIAIGLIVFSFYWQWNLANYTFSKKQVRPARVFRILFRLAIIYNVILMITFLLIINIQFIQNSEVTTIEFEPVLQSIYLVSYVYSAFMLAKTIVILEKNIVDDYFFTGILIMFLPFGIWVIQPRVRKLFKQKTRHP